MVEQEEAREVDEDIEDMEIYEKGQSEVIPCHFTSKEVLTSN